MNPLEARNRRVGRSGLSRGFDAVDIVEDADEIELDKALRSRQQILLHTGHRDDCGSRLDSSYTHTRNTKALGDESG
jgi:hypothetical protein